MTKWVRIGLITLFLAGLTACGQKGPLYLPGNDSIEEQTIEADAGTDQSGS